MAAYYQGTFKPKNPEKYLGNKSEIVYRSSWELLVMCNYDVHPDVIKWSSEEIVIRYLSPLDGREHRYFPDFYVKYKDKNGKVWEEIQEIKPAAQTKPPVAPKRKTKRFINEVMEYGKNRAKWRAAIKYCKDRGYRFRILTENNLGLNKGK